MDQSNRHIVQFPMELKIALPEPVFLLFISLLLSFMFYKFEMRFQKMVKTPPSFKFWLVRRTILRTDALLDVDSGLDHLVSKPRYFMIKHKKVFSLDTYYRLHVISYGIMLSCNNENLQFIVFLMKDSMTFLLNLSDSIPSICFVSSTAPILRKLKILLAHPLI